MFFLKIIYYLFIFAIALVAIMLLVSVLPITGNIKFLTVLSGSMSPAIKTGSVVVVKPAADYQVGDIITFGKISKNQVPVTHRIVEIKDRVFVTKGDANEAADGKEVQKSEILGKVLFDVPYAGFAVDAARKPIGFIFIIGIPAAIIIFDEVGKIIREIKRMRKQKIKGLED